MEQISSTIDAPASVVTPRLARNLVWLLGIILALLIAVGFVLGILAVVASEGELNPFTHLFFLPFVSGLYTLVGGQVALRHSRNPIGWLLLVVGLSSVAVLLANVYDQYLFYTGQTGWPFLLEFLQWLNSWVWWISSMLPVTFVLLLFPDGKLPSPRWRVIAWAAGIGFGLSMVGTALHPGDWPEIGIIHSNPYGIAGARGFLEAVVSSASPFFAMGVAGSMVSVIVRFRRSKGIERAQLKWLAYAAGLVGIGLAIFASLWFVLPESAELIEVSIIFTTLGVTVIVVAIGIAILRYRLWDIDRLINRTLVYGILTVIVASMYVLIVTVFSLLLNTNNDLVFSLFATGLVAVLFQPLREVVQRWINRLLFGYRDEPYTVLQRLSERLEPVVVIDQVLPTIVATVAEALQLPYVAISLFQQEQERIAAVYPNGEAVQNEANLEALPLVYQSTAIGRLLLSPRRQGEPFSLTDRHLLETIAHQAAVAAYNVRLTEELQRSRERLVTMREEERRRLRRDLHDGLGPILASMSLRLDAINNLVDSNPEEARLLVTGLKAQVQTSLTDIRRIAYNLRPPALDELGLLGALREHFAAAAQPESPQIIFESPDHLPMLSAATEVALYRIALEAVTNVLRHARAKSCHVRLTCNHEVTLEVMDDGIGIAMDTRAGVGLTAMQERAAELGGSCKIDARSEGGTMVVARLPLVGDG